MSIEAKPSYKPNIMFSHFGLATSDLPRMVDFYTRVLGFTITDHGIVKTGMELVFLSREPNDHHQIVLVNGRPDNLPKNPFNQQFGSVINQISFRVGTLQQLREIYGIMKAENAASMFPANHGVAWALYCHDPEGNNLEFFVDTDWYFPQPFAAPLDFGRSDEDIFAETERLSREQPEFELYSDWRTRIGAQMNRYQPPS